MISICSYKGVCLILTTVMEPVYPRESSYALNESIYLSLNYSSLFHNIPPLFLPSALGILSTFAMISFTREIFLFSSLVSLSLSHTCTETLPQNTSISLSFLLMAHAPPPHSSPSTVSRPLWSLLSAELFHLSFAFIYTPLVGRRDGGFPSFIWVRDVLFYVNMPRLMQIESDTLSLLYTHSLVSQKEQQKDTDYFHSRLTNLQSFGSDNYI